MPYFKQCFLLMVSYHNDLVWYSVLSFPVKKNNASLRIRSLLKIKKFNVRNGGRETGARFFEVKIKHPIKKTSDYLNGMYFNGMIVGC